jgi:hypothetical protein
MGYLLLSEYCGLIIITKTYSMKNLILPKETIFMIFLITSFCLLSAIHLLALISGEFVKVLSVGEAYYIIRPALISVTGAYLIVLFNRELREKDKFVFYQLLNLPFLIIILYLRDGLERILSTFFATVFIVIMVLVIFLNYFYPYIKEKYKKPEVKV